MIRCHVALLLLAAAAPLPSCSCGDPPATTKQEPTGPKSMLPNTLTKRRIPGTSIVLAVPKTWEVHMPDPGPLPAPTGAIAGSLQLASRTLLQARPGQAGEGHLVAPTILVLQDPWLPVGTAAVDYLVAQRASNAKVIGSAIRHVDAEPSRRQGRPAYVIRDEWSVTIGSAAPRDLSQDALLLLDAAPPISDGAQPAVHGYTIVVTMEKEEREQLDLLVRQVLDSVEFVAIPTVPSP